MQKYLLNDQLEKKAFTYQDLEQKLKEIYEKQTSSFKINLAFGFVLYHVVEKIFKYYYVSNNNMLFEHAITITNKWDLDKFLKKVMDLDLPSNYYLK